MVFNNGYFICIIMMSALFEIITAKGHYSETPSLNLSVLYATPAKVLSEHLEKTFVYFSKISSLKSCSKNGDKTINFST